MVRRQIMLRCRATPKSGPRCSSAAQNGRFVSQICNRGATSQLSFKSECDFSPEFSFAAEC